MHPAPSPCPTALSPSPHLASHHPPPQPLTHSLPMTPGPDPTEPPVRVVAPEAAQTRVRSTPGGDLELAVHLSGPGGPVRWYKDGERLASQGRVQLEQDGARQVLRVRGARSRDAGEYLCDTPQDSRIFLVSVEGNSVVLTPLGPRPPHQGPHAPPTIHPHPPLCPPMHAQLSHG